MSIRLESPAFEEGYPLPRRFTCDGAAVSPPLAWYDVPEAAESLAVVLEDQDERGGKAHWIIFNIPPNCPLLPDNIPASPSIEKGVRQALNDFSRQGYAAPCPGERVVRYFFRIFALDQMLNLPLGVRSPEFKRAIEGHIVDQGVLSTISRPRRVPPWSTQSAQGLSA